MTGVNLIPMHRREQMQRRLRARQWILGGTGYAAVLAVIYVICASVWAGDDQALSTRLQKIPKDIEETTRAIASLQMQFNEAQARFDAAKAITDQPNWSVLMALVGQTVGEEILLNEVRLEPLEPLEGTTPLKLAPGAPAPTSRPARPSGYQLSISGLGRSQSSVSQFVLRLEQLELFARVSLIKTNREVLGTGEATAFRITAQIIAEKKRPG